MKKSIITAVLLLSSAAFSLESPRVSYSESVPLIEIEGETASDCRKAYKEKYDILQKAGKAILEAEECKQKSHATGELNYAGFIMFH